MSGGKTPFVKKTVDCPMCNAKSENRFIMPKSYVEKTVESDRHVAAYKWMDEDYVQFHPPFYHFWHCSSCKYTASQRDFLKPGEDSHDNYSLIKKTFIQMSPAQKQIAQLLGSEIDYDKIDFKMAMNLHLLAIFIQQLVSIEDRDTSKIASYYLRTGWLIREQKARQDPDGQMADYANFLAKLVKLWPEVPQTEDECLKTAAANFEKAYQSHPKYADVVHATDLMILIADIYLRANDMAMAMKSLNNVMQTGQKFRQQISETMRREKEAGKLDLTRKAQIDAQASRVNVLMEKAGDMRQEIIKVKIAEQEPKAKAVVAKLEGAGMDSELIREKLKELNFEPQLITKLLGEPKRKKFLGLF